MISVSAGDYRGGDYLFHGLSSLGQGLGEALQRYQQMKDQQTQADMLMSTLAQMPDPTEFNPDTGAGIPGASGSIGAPAGAGAGAAGGPMGMLLAAASGQKTGSGSSASKTPKQRMILDPKSYERYLAVSGRNHAAAAAGLMGALQMYNTMQKAALEAALTRAQTRQAGAHADYYQARQDPSKELQLFTNPAVTTVRPEPGGAQFEPFPMVQVSPQQWRPVNRPGEPVYDEQTGMYILPAGPTGGRPTVVKPEDVATAQALKPQPTATPKPPGAVRKFFGPRTPNATPSPTPTAAGEKVKVIDPSGRVGLIPAEQVPAALSQGYKLAP